MTVVDGYGLLTSTSRAQITCLYDMDLVDPLNFDSVYVSSSLASARALLIMIRTTATSTKS